MNETEILKYLLEHSKIINEMYQGLIVDSATSADPKAIAKIYDDEIYILLGLGITLIFPSDQKHNWPNLKNLFIYVPPSQYNPEKTQHMVIYLPLKEANKQIEDICKELNAFLSSKLNSRRLISDCISKCVENEAHTQSVNQKFRKECLEKQIKLPKIEIVSLQPTYIFINPKIKRRVTLIITPFSKKLAFELIGASKTQTINNYLNAKDAELLASLGQF